MNNWERQFYRQLSRVEAGAGDVAGLEAWRNKGLAFDRRAALEAALLQALVEVERAHGD